MWLIFGILAIFTALLNILCAMKHRDGKWFRFISLALTALTVCSFYSMVGNWVAAEDWSAMLDVVPAVSKMLWILTIGSIVINGVSLFGKGNT